MSAYVFVVGDYIEVRDAGNVFAYQLHYTELSITRNVAGWINFAHRRDSAEIYPIISAPFDEVLKQSGVPYSTVSEEAFFVAFNAILPTASAASTGVEDIVDGLGLTAQTVEMAIATSSGTAVHSGGATRAISIVALTPTTVFSVLGISYPLATANGIIDEFSASATAGCTLSGIAYTVTSGSVLVKTLG